MARSGIHLGLEFPRGTFAPFRGIKGAITEIKRDLLDDIVRYWHKELFPGHFTPGAERRYGYEPRTEAYIKKKLRYGKGHGRYVANIFSGKSLSWMQGSARFTSTAQSATVKMSAPAYFTKPYVGVVHATSRLGKPFSFTIKRQPNKAKEVTRASSEDIRKMQKFGQKRIMELIKRSRGMKAAA